VGEGVDITQPYTHTRHPASTLHGSTIHPSFFKQRVRFCLRWHTRTQRVVVTSAHAERRKDVGLAKWRNKMHRGTARDFLESYLAEFMWRMRHKDENPFDAILKVIKNYWPPEVEI